MHTSPTNQESARKSIHQLIPDIYNLVGGTDGLSDALTSHMGIDIADAIQKSLGKQDRRGLRLSGLGDKCPCHLWYSINRPELAEPLPPYAKIKYAFGHIVEHMLIGLAKAAGHEVTGEQDELNVDGVTGHRDCVIDGAVCDIKSSSSRGFAKFRDKTLAESDDFGYLDQLDSYAVGSLLDPLVTIKDKAYILAIDKTLGHLALYEHTVRPVRIRERIAKHKQVVNMETPPHCTCGTEADGESGNFKLDVKASYNPFKHVCAKNRGERIRTFLFAGGPRFLTKVVRTPTYKGFPIKELTSYH